MSAAIVRTRDRKPDMPPGYRVVYGAYCRACDNSVLIHTFHKGEVDPVVRRHAKQHRGQGR